MTAVKNIPALIGGAAVLAAAAIGLTTATANALWDLEKYDACMKKSTNDRSAELCCLDSGGTAGTVEGSCYGKAKLEVAPDQGPGLPPPIIDTVGSPPTLATNAPVSPAPGSNAPGGVSPGNASR